MSADLASVLELPDGATVAPRGHTHGQVLSHQEVIPVTVSHVGTETDAWGCIQCGRVATDIEWFNCECGSDE